ncbi:MAG: class I SAM-dependent methyltransferase [Kiritimatiellae bacterium]|nr:class I SAM-dependent methyltransferase [Kiritimatiellia bacterium]
MTCQRLAASFRDPSGFIYTREGVLYRQVNAVYRDDYDRLTGSGLLESLWRKGLLVRHREVGCELAAAPGACRVLQPDRVAFISHPYEWPFSAWKDAALATLQIQSEALKHGMSLKDASAYNIQFADGRPLLIDTLSFERREPGSPWPAYRQFCQHFLAPLALMSRRDVRLAGLMKSGIDGIPLDLADALLGRAARWSPRLLIHIHMHAHSQRRHARADGQQASATRARKMSDLALEGILDSLRGAIESLRWHPAGTEWADYYDFTNYSADSFQAKRDIVERFLAAAAPRQVWDLGANNGAFSRIASRRGIPTVAFDIDPAAVEKNYRQMRRDGEVNLLPLLQDLTNPSPSLGWAGRERDSLAARGPADMLFALALIHHLAIGNNVPLGDVAAFLAEIGRHLIVEFVPKEDSQVRHLLASRKDIFDGYHEAGFEAAFKAHFSIREKAAIPGTCRTLYWMSKTC